MRAFTGWMLLLAGGMSGVGHPQDPASAETGPAMRLSTEIQVTQPSVQVANIAPIALPPRCLKAESGKSIEATVTAVVSSPLELLGRLVYAEGVSTGFPEDPAVFRALSWGVMNRVRLGERSASLQRQYGVGLQGVIFKPGQFNPALSPRSAYSKEFLCPQQAERWVQAMDAARSASRGWDNPFIQTDWERAHGLSLVVNFYYPQSRQAKGPLPPWEGSSALVLVQNPRFDDYTLSGDRIRFYRLAHPPKDVKPSPPNRPNP